MFQKIFLPLIFIFAFISCSSDDDFTDELNANRLLWQSSQIKDYTLNERISCFCGGLLSWDVFVLNSIKDRVEFDETQLPSNQIYDDIFNNSRTVEESFDFIESLLSQNVASLNVEYDDVYGFPNHISIDYVANAVDDEISYIYTSFEITN